MLRTNIRNGLAPGLNQPQSPESPAPATPAPASSHADNMASDALASANTTSTNGPRLLAALSQPSIQELSQSPEAKAALKLNQAIAKRVRKATPPLSQRAQERLNSKIERFETLLYRGKVSQNQDVKDVVEAYTQVVRELASLGLMNKALSQSIDQGRNAVLQKFEDDLGMTFSPIVAGEQIIGLQATSNSGEALNAEQNAALDGARVLIFEMERIKAIPGQLRQKEIVLLDLRDALLRYSLESLQPAMLAPENLGTDNPIDLTSAALANVDAMLQSDAPLDVNILNDLKSLAADIESQNLQGLGAQLHGDVSITAPDAPQAPTTTINSNTFDTSAFARRAALRASSAPLGQMNAGQAPQFNTFHLNARNAELMNLVGTMPSDFADPITSFTSAYTDAMDNVEAMLPPGPFTYTMPVPFTIENDDGSSFTIPAGAELSQNPDGTGLITAPGMVMQSGDLQFISGEATVILGENIDNLYFETLNISQGESDLFAMEEVNAQIDTENQSSVFEAQSATVNFSNGNVVFENTTMAFAPGSTVISAGTMLMENGNDQFSMEGFSFSQELNEDTATTSLVGDNTVMTFGENIFNAEHLEINLLQSEDPNNPGQMEMLVQGLDFQNADTSLQADEATLQMLSQADGSSSIVFASSDVDLMMANGQLNTQGATQLEMNYDANGQIQNITTSADSLSFVDTAGNNLNTSGSTFNAEFNENGELTNLGVNAETLDFVSQDGSINASNGNIDLAYDNGILSSASASATELAYSNGNQQLNANGGSLEMQVGTNGFVESLNASAQDVDYNDGTTQAMATNGSLNLSFDQDGNLLSAGGEAGSLTITNPESTIEAQNANFSANYGENGLLESLNASSGDIQASGDFGVLQTQGQSTLDLSYHDNGNLGQMETSLGQVHFENPNGETLEITDGAAQMTFNEEGFLEGMTGNAEHLQWSNNDGSSLDAQGMNMNIVMGENGMLQSADASSGALTYTNAFGTLNTQGNSSVQMTCNDNGTITQLNLNSDDAHFVSRSDDVHALGGAAQLNFSESGQLISMDASANQVELQGAYGSLTTANQAQVNLDFNESGSLTQMQAQAASLQHTQGNSSLSLENVTLYAEFSEDGLMPTIEASVAPLTHVQDGNT
ncbi:MAG: hypothetical protein QGI45_07055, partial [Myxococcota bacterium]|nr:hypothetical protein [Myxococcota bacterium]